MQFMLSIYELPGVFENSFYPEEFVVDDGRAYQPERVADRKRDLLSVWADHPERNERGGFLQGASVSQRTRHRLARMLDLYIHADR